jgi:hypothetical protein
MLNLKFDLAAQFNSSKLHHPLYFALGHSLTDLELSLGLEMVSVLSLD